MKNQHSVRPIPTFPKGRRSEHKASFMKMLMDPIPVGESGIVDEMFY
ncbi:MAG TPA: hypothetical protein VF144_08945 [Chitinophagaceae bacterium]